MSREKRKKVTHKTRTRAITSFAATAVCNTKTFLVVCSHRIPHSRLHILLTKTSTSLCEIVWLNTMIGITRIICIHNIDEQIHKFILMKMKTMFQIHYSISITKHQLNTNPIPNKKHGSIACTLNKVASKL